MRLKRPSMLRPACVSNSDRTALLSSKPMVLRIIRLTRSEPERASRYPVGRSGSPPARLIAMVASAETAAIGAMGMGSKNAAVGEQPAVVQIRLDDAGNGDRRADRICQRTALDPDGTAGDEIGGDRGERDRQLLHGDIADDLFDGVEDLLGPQDPGRPE